MSMNIYEIDQAIQGLIDPETGELLDFEQFAALNMERESKIENMALWVKDLSAEAKAIREEEKALAERRQTAENKADRLKKYLDQILTGEKFSTSKVAISYRKASAVQLDEGFVEWAKTNASELLRYAEPAADKTLIKDYIKAGNVLEMARLVESQSLQIK